MPLPSLKRVLIYYTIFINISQVKVRRFMLDFIITVTVERDEVRNPVSGGEAFVSSLFAEKMSTYF